jgi:hypothetical protein
MTVAQQSAAAWGRLIMTAPNVTTLKCPQPIAACIPNMPSLRVLRVLHSESKLDFREDSPPHWPNIEVLDWCYSRNGHDCLDIRHFSKLRSLDLGCITIPEELLDIEASGKAAVDFLVSLIDSFSLLEHIVADFGAIVMYHDIANYVLDEFKPERHRRVLAAVSLDCCGRGAVDTVDALIQLGCYDQAVRIMQLPFYGFQAFNDASCFALSSSGPSDSELVEFVTLATPTIRKAISDGKISAYASNNVWSEYCYFPAMFDLGLHEALHKCGFLIDEPTFAVNSLHWADWDFNGEVERKIIGSSVWSLAVVS